jgi:hypothetical protein
MSKMPHIDWKEWAMKRPDWMRQDVTSAYEAFIEKKWLDALNIAATEPAPWRGDREKATGGARTPDKTSGGGRGVLRLTGAVNVIERGETPRSPSPPWDLSFRRKCRARNLIGCDGNHVMLQCEKLMRLGLAERKNTLEKSGLCMFCLKHAADLECYGKGGLSKPRCALPGCDGEHTPDVHALMGEESAGVNVTAGDGGGEEDEDEDEEGEDEEGEYEDEEWWVGTVGVMEVPDRARKTPLGMLYSGQEQEDYCSEADISSQPEEGTEYLLSDCLASEVAEGKCWDMGPTHSDLRRDGGGVRPLRAPQRPADGVSWSPYWAGAKRKEVRKESGATRDQEWEEARRDAWLRQMLSDTSSDEDEDEGRYGRFAESRRWAAELYKIPQCPAPSSGGECSG